MDFLTTWLKRFADVQVRLYTLSYSSLKPWGCVSRRGPEGEEGGRWDILQGPQAQEAAQPELWQAL